MSRDTIRKAFGKLENEDYIVKKTAVGTFVKYKKSNYGSKADEHTGAIRVNLEYKDVPHAYVGLKIKY